MNGIENRSWGEVFDFRNEMIEQQITLIARDNMDYYNTIYSTFAQHGRYHKLVGNHDVALTQKYCMVMLREETGLPFEDPDETLILSDDDRHHYFICHGHQFDHSCIAEFAKHLGETYSQSGAWAIEGPDRTWKYNIDWLDEMLKGERLVYNNIVGDEAKGLSAGDWAVLATAFSAGGILAGMGGGLFVANGLLSVGALEIIFDIVPPRNLIEELMGKNVAWEYFKHPDDLARVALEFISGTRWFKFRHMDEIALSRFTENEPTVLDGVQIKPPPWGDEEPPVVLLGHTHEPRQNARRPSSKEHLAPHYINSGAAGRFENLLWAVELIEGEARMVSWHSDEDGAVIRPASVVAMSYNNDADPFDIEGFVFHPDV